MVTTELSLSRSNVTSGVYHRDLTCRVSQSTEGLAAAQLVPRVEASWFDRNGISIYGAIGAGVGLEDQKNVILMRADLYKSFDNRMFVFTPKDNKFVIHLLLPSLESL